MEHDRAWPHRFAWSISEEPLSTSQLGEIYQDYSVRVYRFIAYRVASTADAQDLTSAVFERVIAKYHSFDPAKGNFEVWLFSIARNLLRDHYRRAGRWQMFGLDAAKELPSQEKSPEQLVLDAERFAELEAALACLQQRELCVVSLKYAAELRNVDIAKVMRLSEKNVGVILCRAMKKLRLQMQKEEIE